MHPIAGEFLESGLDDVTGDPKQLAEQLANQLIADTGQETKEATDLATQILFDKRKLKTIEFTDESNAFFSVGDQSGVILLKINKEHEFHSELYQNLVDDPLETFDPNISETEQIEELKSRLSKATRALILTFSSWARMEYDFINASPEMKGQIRGIRQQWGAFLKRFLKE